MPLSYSSQGPFHRHQPRANTHLTSRAFCSGPCAAPLGAGSTPWPSMPSMLNSTRIRPADAAAAKLIVPRRRPSRFRLCHISPSSSSSSTSSSHHRPPQPPATSAARSCNKAPGRRLGWFAAYNEGGRRVPLQHASRHAARLEPSQTACCAPHSRASAAVSGSRVAAPLAGHKHEHEHGLGLQPLCRQR